MRSHVAQLAQLSTRTAGLCLHGHAYRTAPASLGHVQALISSAVSSSSHCSSSAELPRSSLSDHDASSNDSCQLQSKSQSQQLQGQQQLQPQHYSLRSSMMSRLASGHSSGQRSGHQSISAAQSGQCQLSKLRAFQHQPTPFTEQQAMPAAAQVRHVTNAVSRLHADQQDIQHTQRIVSHSKASCSGRLASVQPRAPASVCEGTRQFSAFADVGQTQNPDLQKPSFQRAPPQRPFANQQRPPNGPAHQRRPNLGMCCSDH